jgi:hypothetical protein
MRYRVALPETGHRHFPRLIVVGFAAVTVLGGAAAVYAGTGGSFYPATDRSSVEVITPPASASGSAQFTDGGLAEGSPNRGRISQMAQSGVISALSDHSATVLSYDGFAQTYALTVHTTITEQPQRADRASANALHVGDWVLIEALRTATGPMATSVTKGSMPLDILIAPSGSS